MAHPGPPKTGLGGTGVDLQEFLSSPLDLFSDQAEDSNYEMSYKEYIPSLTPITDNSNNIEFHAQPSIDYTNLSKTRLVGKLQVMKVDGTSKTAIGDGDDISCINALPLNLFKQCRVQVNTTDIVDLNFNYHLKAYLETLLSFNDDTKKSYLASSCMYIPDEPDHMTKNTKTATAAAASGSGSGSSSSSSSTTTPPEKTPYDKRREILKSAVSFSIPIHCDFFQCPKLLFSGNDLRITLTRNSDDFCLIAPRATTSYKIFLQEMKLELTRVRVSPLVSEIHAKRLGNGQLAKYHFPESEINTFVLPAKVTSAEIPNLVKGNLPQMLVVGFMDSAQYNGDITKNSLQFKHCDIQSLYFKINGRIIPSEPYTPTFTAGSESTLREYLDLSNMLALNDSYVVNLSQDFFNKGLTLFGCDTSADQCNMMHKHEEKPGNISLHVRFANAPDAPIHVICYSVKHQTLSIDQTRNVTRRLAALSLD